MSPLNPTNNPANPSPAVPVNNSKSQRFAVYMKDVGQQALKGVLTTGAAMLITHLFLSVHPIAGGLIFGASALGGLTGYAIARIFTDNQKTAGFVGSIGGGVGYFGMATKGLERFGYANMTAGSSAMYGLKVGLIGAVPVALIIGLVILVAVVIDQKQKKSVTV